MSSNKKRLKFFGILVLVSVVSSCATFQKYMNDVANKHDPSISSEDLKSASVPVSENKPDK